MKITYFDDIWNTSKVSSNAPVIVKNVNLSDSDNNSNLSLEPQDIKNYKDVKPLLSFLETYF